MEFKKWLNERFIDPDFFKDMSNNPDFVRGGFGNDQDLPIGLRTISQATTSAFPTYSIKSKMRKMKKR